MCSPSGSINLSIFKSFSFSKHLLLRHSGCTHLCPELNVYNYQKATPTQIGSWPSNVTFSKRTVTLWNWSGPFPMLSYLCHCKVCLQSFQSISVSEQLQPENVHNTDMGGGGGVGAPEVVKSSRPGGLITIYWEICVFSSHRRCLSRLDFRCPVLNMFLI